MPEFAQFARLFVGLVTSVALGVLPTCGVLYLIYFLLTIPMRRKERARIFLDLLEMGLKEGRSPELAIEGPSSSRDTSLGARFHLLAAYLEQGMSLTQALDEVPRLLPPNVTAMLKTGQRIGDIRKVLPACRYSLRDGVSHVRGAMNYLVVLAFVITPFAIIIPIVLRGRVMPSFRTVFDSMYEGSAMPAFTRFVLSENGWFSLCQIVMLVLLWVALLFYIGGPRFRSWISAILPERELISPWRWKRLKRDFSTMLALLLDAGVPEHEAVGLAAESTASFTLRSRAEQVVDRLKQGVKLPDALRLLDNSGELQWRIANALRRGKGFLQALAGWHEALDAKAFQQEQTAAQITTSGLLLINGLFVAALVCAVFLALVNLLNAAVLW
jgi:type II secretory pathway component PulF